MLLLIIRLEESRGDIIEEARGGRIFSSWEEIPKQNVSYDLQTWDGFYE